jgi:putative inorganic carbon (HCO3(-)) transporter
VKFSGVSLPGSMTVRVNQRNWLQLLPWIFSAIAFGVVVAVLPVTVALALSGAAALAIALLYSPQAALVLLLVCAPLRALIDVRAPGLLPLDAGQIGLALMAGVWITHRVARKQPLLKLEMSPALLAVGGFVTAGAISGFSAANTGVWLNDWLKWVFAFILMLLVLTDGRWEWALFALALAGIANALVGIWIYFGGSGAEHFLISGDNYRAFGTFEQPNPFGGFMGMLSPLMGAAAYGYLRLSWQQVRRPKYSQPLMQAAFYGFAAIITAAALVMSWSRGAWLAFGVAVAVLMISLPRKLWVSVVIVALIGVAGTGAILSGRLPESITERIGSAFTDLINVSDVRGVAVSSANYAVIERLAHWQAAVEMARISPLTGVGLGNYEVVYPQVRLMAWKFPLGHAHNYYLNVLAEAGMIGAAAYGAMWLIIAALTWRARRHPDPVASAAAAGLLGSWTYIAVHSITDQLYVNYAFLHVGTMFGLAALLYAHTWKHNRLNPL